MVHAVQWLATHVPQTAWGIIADAIATALIIACIAQWARSRQDRYMGGHDTLLVAAMIASAVAVIIMGWGS